MLISINGNTVHLHKLRRPYIHDYGYAFSYLKIFPLKTQKSYNKDQKYQKYQIIEDINFNIQCSTTHI